MDKLDRQILSHLLNNCRKSDRQIGNEIGISGVAVKSRIQKMIENKIIEKFALKIEPPVLGFSVLYFVVTGKEIDDIIQKIGLVGELFFVVPCVGGVTVCSIVVKENPTQKMELAKNLLRDIRVLSIFEAKNPEIRSDLTKTDIGIIDILLQDPRLKIEEIAEKSGFSTKTVARSLEKLQNDEAIQFTAIYNPKNMGEFIPFAILVGVKGDIKKTLAKLDKTFSGSFLQKPFVHMNQIVLFMYTDNIYKMDDLSAKVPHIEEILSVDLFIPKKITFQNKWVQNAIMMAKKSKKLHLMSEIHS
ncbi:MAG: AsnC family transcriptional regulator [Thaumarchaeota archaeon]|nr:AsnC family transcriptional regulator [Nitrososphaerota archaeon]MDE1818237.1 AsnC family transcriptional regulator [Nitrososphaerota archaeon]MDE1875950.1 AsnC family transcriptional regulator [Nitrososphaerota archaeon]